MRLKLKDEAKAAIFGLPLTDMDSDTITSHYEERGWAVPDIMRHIQAAIDAGAYEKQETSYPIRKERVTRKTQQVGGNEDKEVDNADV